VKRSKDHFGTSTDDQGVRICSTGVCDVLQIWLNDHPFSDLSLIEQFQIGFSVKRSVTEISRSDAKSKDVRIAILNQTTISQTAADMPVDDIPVRRRPTPLRKETETLRGFIAARFFYRNPRPPVAGTREA